MSRPRARSLAAVAGLVLAVAGCSSRKDERAKEEVFSSAAAARAKRPFDFGHPVEALRTGADEAAAREGSFAWEARVSWTVARPGTPPLRAEERHLLRQLATGEFEVSADVDPGAGPGSETGKQIVYARGMTYARGRWAPFRERPTDRGRDARRYRDESFRLAGDLADLYGPALAASPAGESTWLGRRARRFRLSLSGAAPREAPPPPDLPDGGYDADTRRRVDFLEGRVPAALEGELLLDADTGVPLSVTMRGAFSERADPQLRAQVELAAEVKAIGGDVAAVLPPKGALTDERKPKGVARALEAAGLRKRAGGEEREGAEDEGEGEPPPGE